MHSWLVWRRERGHDAPAVPGWVKRLAAPDSTTPVRSRMTVDRLIARREVGLREKTLWRMLYETAARVEEILSLNIEDLDFAGRRAQVKARAPGLGPGAAGRRARPSCWRPCTGTQAPPGFCPGC